MSMKEFLGKKSFIYIDSLPDMTMEHSKSIKLNDLFVFLWERGAEKHIVSMLDKVGEDFEEIVNHTQKYYKGYSDAQDFLDCVVINEAKVKERVEELMK